MYDVSVKTVDEANFLKSLDGQEGFDFWVMPRLLGSTSTVMVTPEYQELFEYWLDERNVEYGISIADLEK